MSCGEAKAQRHKDDISLHRFPENTSVASTCVVHLKPIPQGEALGQVNQPFSQEDWESVSVCCLRRAMGMAACPELSFLILQSCGVQEHKPLWPPEPGDQETSLVCTVLTHQL